MISKYYFYVSLITGLLILCNCIGRAEKLIIPYAMQKEINNQYYGGNILVYYHSGECSFCYGNLMSISKKFPDLLLVSISASNDAILVDYYLEQIKFKGISLIDSNSLFLKSNQTVLSSRTLFLIDSENKIKATGIVLDKETIKMIEKAIH
jgi:hypothetical protein